MMSEADVSEMAVEFEPSHNNVFLFLFLERGFLQNRTEQLSGKIEFDMSIKRCIIAEQIGPTDIHQHLLKICREQTVDMNR